MPGMRISEIVVVLITSLVYLVPLAAMIWAIFTLRRIRDDNEAIKSKLDMIERQLQRGA